MKAGVPVIRFTGGRNTTTYDASHTVHDTVEHVYELACGPANFEVSFENAVLVSDYTILAYDRYDPKLLSPLEPPGENHP